MKQKPEWITEEQWKAVPSIGWWENNRKGAEYIKEYQKHPLSPEEKLLQQKRRDKALGIENNF